MASSASRGRARWAPALPLFLVKKIAEGGRAGDKRAPTPLPSSRSGSSVFNPRPRLRKPWRWHGAGSHAHLNCKSRAGEKREPEPPTLAAADKSYVRENRAVSCQWLLTVTWATSPTTLQFKLLSRFPSSKNNNQPTQQTTWPLFKYSCIIIITKKFLENANYKMYNK